MPPKPPFNVPLRVAVSLKLKVSLPKPPARLCMSVKLVNATAPVTLPAFALVMFQIFAPEALLAVKLLVPAPVNVGKPLKLIMLLLVLSFTVPALLPVSVQAVPLTPLIPVKVLLAELVSFKASILLNVVLPTAAPSDPSYPWLPIPVNVVFTVVVPTPVKLIVSTPVPPVIVPLNVPVL